MNTLERLKGAKARIEKGWTKGDFAKDKDGWSVSAVDETATCFCTIGALRAEFGHEKVRQVGYRKVKRLIQKYAEATEVGQELEYEYGFSIAGFNDHPRTTKEDVLAVFDAAIKELEDEHA